MDRDSIFNIVITILVIGALFAGYGIYWHIKSDQLEEIVKTDLNEIKAGFSAVGIKLDYDGVETYGYPNLPMAKILAPSLTIEADEHKITYAAAELNIIPEKMNFGIFSIKLPNVFSMSDNITGEGVTEYNITATNVPGLNLRTSKESGGQSDYHIVQFSYNMPHFIRLDMLSNKKTWPLMCKFPMDSSRAWVPITYMLNGKMLSLYNMVIASSKHAKEVK